MGLIRKTLMIGSCGIIRGSSKKQRIAKATLKATRAQARAAQEHHATAADRPTPPPHVFDEALLPAGWYRRWDGQCWTVHIKETP